MKIAFLTRHFFNVLLLIEFHETLLKKALVEPEFPVNVLKKGVPRCWKWESGVRKILLVTQVTSVTRHLLQALRTVHSLDFHSNLYPTWNTFRGTFMLLLPCTFLQPTDAPNKTEFMTSIKLHVSAPGSHSQGIF